MKVFYLIVLNNPSSNTFQIITIFEQLEVILSGLVCILDKNELTYLPLMTTTAVANRGPDKYAKNN